MNYIHFKVLNALYILCFIAVSTSFSQTISENKVIESIQVKSPNKLILEEGEYKYHSIDAFIVPVDSQLIESNLQKLKNETIRTNNVKVENLKSTDISIDSGSINQEIETLKKDFRKDLEGSLNGLVLADLTKDDMSNRVTSLVNNYQENERFKNALNYDEQLTSRLKEFGEKEVSTEWLNSKISNARIFEEYPPEIYSDKEAFKQSITKLKILSTQKSEIFENWDLDDSGLNEYHKLMKGQISIDEFEKNVNPSTGNMSEDKKIVYENLIEDIKEIKTEEKQIVEQLKDNKYLKNQQEEFGQSFDILEKYDERGMGEDLVLSELNEYRQTDNIQDVLKNDFVSQYLYENQPNLDKVGGGVIKKEVAQALDTLDEDWIPETNILEKDRKEVEELVLNDPHTKKLLPENTFFEGIIGFAKGDFAVFSLSPNFGYTIKNGPSIGVGVTLHHTQDERAYIRTALDYKVFSKYEVFKDIFFIQADYVFMIPGMSYLEAEAGVSEFKQTVLVGGGFFVKIKGKKLFSIGCMYNTNQNMGVPTYDVPFLARLGIKLF